jgi:ketosteroid isomerase-like protein
VELVRHADDHTLMRPDGGETVHGFHASPEQLDEMSRLFSGGEAGLELEQLYASGDLVVLVVVERQHAAVGGQPDQDLSLRVTLVFRRDGDDWALVHRHADPLVHGIGPEQLSALLRG